MKQMDQFVDILLQELIPAQGCTEPIAIALSAARAREILGREPDSLTVYLAGNMIKNAKSVTVPNSGGEKGIPIAAALGAIAGDAAKLLQALTPITAGDVVRAKQFVEDGRVELRLVDDEENLFVRTVARCQKHESYVEIKYDHTRYHAICFDGEMILDKTREVRETSGDKRELLSLEAIVDFADAVDFSVYPALVDCLERQISLNEAIAHEGLTHAYGVEVGRTLMAGSDGQPGTIAKAKAAAGSDARMNGSDLPVVINSGSGNQGITVSIPVLAFANASDIDHDRVLRALIVSNLTAIHQKRFIGKLSAFCGVVSAAAAAAAGIAYMEGKSPDVIANTIINTLGTAGGIVCDGAKASCAAKIALSLDNALVAKRLAENNHVFQAGDGIVGDDVEATIRNVGRMAKDGMKSTDLEILLIMTGK